MKQITKTTRNAWAWIPTLYFGQGIPYVVVMMLSVIMYKKMGLSNTEIALYTSWLYLPWVIKPLWSPFIEMFRTKRFWILSMQLLIGAALALVALTLPTSNFFQITLAIFWLMAFSSATHDIAADGFYMLALKEQQQAAFVGVRSTFYRISMIAGQGGLVYIAGYFEESTGNVTHAWSIVFFILAAMFFTLFVYHKFMLPIPVSDHATTDNTPPWQQFWSVFVKFMQKREIISILAFLLLFRFAEAQLVKLAAPFLLDGRENGGLGISTQGVGLVYGTVGVIALTLGGLLGGYAISRLGLKRLLWIMVMAVNVPNVVYVYLALTLPTELTIISTAVAIEQFGYGFGFSAYMMFMIMVADGEHKTAHYAICTGFMALGMMLPGMASGWIEEQLGYANFFIWICIATIPSFIAASFIKVKPEFGKRQE
jgi:PAT family beta-lactamase induction signal transducer AmpG